MTDKEIDKSIENDPYAQYMKDRTRELIYKLAGKISKNDGHSWLEFCARLCQMVSLDEGQILQNQAVLDDPSPYPNGSRDRLLNMFSQNYINHVMKGKYHNRSLTKLERKRDGQRD